jgi:two-component system chemotaxis response regulator CheY
MSYSVLIVDDSPAMQGLITRVLGLCGLKIRAFLRASNGKEALSILEHCTVDLILTDMNMPELDGEALIRSLAQNERLNDIPVIVISTDSTEARIDQLMSLGARGYVAKPFTPERLRSEIEGVLGVSHV